MATIPVIDISPLVQLAERGGVDGPNIERLDEVVSQIARACETVGFFAVTNHGVDAAVASRAWEASRAFFDCDAAVKGAVAMRGDYPYGYESHEALGTARLSALEAIGEEGEGAPSKVEGQMSALSPDSKETFSIGPADTAASGMPARQFPQDAPTAFAPTLTEYFGVMENLARVLFWGLALALGLDDASWFLRDGCFDEGHQCALRILNYPQLEIEDESKKVRIRAGAHTDYGAMTILKSGGPGLQLRLSNETTGANGGDSSSWIDVPHLPDAFIINLGDLMQRWTNDRWKSTLHRVIAVADNVDPDADDQSSSVFHSSRRQSIAFFVNMNGNATVVPFGSCVDDDHPVRYGAIRASDHLIQRHRQSMGNGAKK